MGNTLLRTTTIQPKGIRIKRSKNHQQYEDECFATSYWTEFDVWKSDFDENPNNHFLLANQTSTSLMWPQTNSYQQFNPISTDNYYSEQTLNNRTSIPDHWISPEVIRKAIYTTIDHRAMLAERIDVEIGEKRRHHSDSKTLKSRKSQTHHLEEVPLVDHHRSRRTNENSSHRSAPNISINHHQRRQETTSYRTY